MSIVHEEPVRTAPEQVSGRSSPVTPSADRRRWRWLVAALVVAAMVIGGGLWWLLDSTVPVSDYDDVLAELAATEEALAHSRTDLLMEQATTAELEQRNRGLEAAMDSPTASTEGDAELRARFGIAEPAALLLGYFAGVDPEIVDQEQYQSWSGVVKLDMAVEALDDPELTELYREHLGECTGISRGCEELLLRLIELTIEPILEDG